MTDRQAFIHFTLGFLTVLAPGRLQKDGQRLIVAARDAADVFVKSNDTLSLAGRTDNPEDVAFDFALSVIGRTKPQAMFVDIIAALEPARDPDEFPDYTGLLPR